MRKEVREDILKILRRVVKILEKGLLQPAQGLEQPHRA